MKRFWFLGLLVLGVCAWCDNPIINYASGWGECEVDFERDGVADLWADTTSGEANEAGISVQYRIDRDTPFSGTGCQQVSVSGRCVLDRYVVAARSEWIPSIGGNYPAPGETVYVDFALRTSAHLKNIQYAVVAGMTRVDGEPEPMLLNWNRQHMPNWQRFTTSFVMPETVDGRFRIIFYMRALSGPTAGSLWIDDIKVYTGKRLPVREGTLKLARVNAKGVDWVQIASDYDLVIANGPNLARFKALRPEIAAWYYALGWESIATRESQYSNVWNGNSLVGNAGDFVPHTFAQQTNPDWFLRDALGFNILAPGGTLTLIYAMDFGDPTLRQFVFQNMRTFFNDVYGSNSSLKPTGYYFDRLNNCLSYQTPRYPTRQDRLAKLYEYMEDFHDQVRVDNLPVIANGYVSPWNTGELAPILQNGWVDGFLIEGFIVNVYTGAIRNPREIANHLISAMDPNRTVIVLGCLFNDDPNDIKFNLALAGFYLVNHPNLYCIVTGRDETNRVDVSKSLVLPQLDLPLGEPLASHYEILAGTQNNGALYARRYTHGIALLNSSQTTSFTYTPTRPMQDHQGQQYRRNQPITIAPQRGLVLYVSPDAYNPR